MDPALAAETTAEVRAFVAAAGRRRSLPRTCGVGRPGGEAVRLVDDGGYDAALRADVVTRALDGLRTTSGACAWTSRSGPLREVEGDTPWLVAARVGFARHGLELPAFLLVTRTGWLDLVGGSSRTWSRVRSRRPPGAR